MPYLPSYYSRCHGISVKYCRNTRILDSNKTYEIDNSRHHYPIATFVCVHVVGRFSTDFLEVRGLRSRGFQLQVEWMTTVLYAEL